MKYIAVLMCVVLSCLSVALSLPDYKPTYRTAIFVDALQTKSIRENGFTEFNPIYKDMGSGEAFVSVLALGYLGERCIESIRHKQTRNMVGWLVTLGELACVANNASVGVPLFSVRF